MPAIVNTPTNTQKIKKVLLVPVRYLIVSLLAVLFIVSFIPIIVFYLIFNAVSKLCSLAGIEILPQRLEQGVEHRRIRELYRNYNNNISMVKRLVNTILLTTMEIAILLLLVLLLPALLCSFLLLLLLQPLLRLLQLREGEPRGLGMLKGSIRVVLDTIILAPLIVLIILVLPFLACFSLKSL